MASLKEMKQIKDKVYLLLVNHPHLRDDDKKLCTNIWWNEIPNIETMSAKDILKMYAEGQLTLPASIGRVRQKLQEQHPELCGAVWYARHKEEQNIRTNIHEL